MAKNVSEQVRKEEAEQAIEDIIPPSPPVRNDTFEILKVMVGEARAKEMLGL